MSLFFENRAQAGEILAKEVQKLKGVDNPLVIGLPRGGVLVGEPVAKTLKVPLEIVLVRKIGAPFEKELALGAIVEGNPPHVLLNHDLVRVLKVENAYIESEKSNQLAEIERQRKVFRANRSRSSATGRNVIVVDDGIATGASAKAVLQALRVEKPKKLILAVPVSHPDTLVELKGLADEVVCLGAPADFAAVGQFFRHFNQVTDDEVVKILSGN